MGKILLGAVAMLAFCVVVVNTSKPTRQYKELKELKEKCEEFLPRNEHCVIVAVPQSKD